MAGVVKFCPKCREENELPFCGYYPFMTEEAVCEIHSCKVETIDISVEDYITIMSISYDINFLEAMIKLKETDIIEYQSRMAQFRNQAEQQKQADREEDNVPKCPTCGSANIEKISVSSKVVGGALFGLFSSNVRKTMHCKNCGYKW